MAFKLKNADRNLLEARKAALTKEREHIEDLVRVLNEQVQAYFEGKLRPAVARYNSELETTREAVDNIATDFQDKFDSRSEQWQESAAGQEAAEFISQFEDAPFYDDLDVGEIPEIDPNSIVGDDAEDTLQTLLDL